MRQRASAGVGYEWGVAKSGGVRASPDEPDEKPARYASPDDLYLVNDSCLRCGLCCCLSACRRQNRLDLYKVFMGCACCIGAALVLIVATLGFYQPTRAAYLNVDPFFALSPWATSFTPCTSKVRDADATFIGGDFLDGAVKSEEWCCRYCEHIGRCTGWTFVEFTSHCWLKDLGRERVRVARLEGHVSGTNDVARHGRAHRAMLKRVAAAQVEGAALVARLHNEGAELVVALTVIPRRLPHLAATLRSIRMQTAQADRVLVVVPKSWKRFDAAAAQRARDAAAGFGGAEESSTTRTIALWDAASRAVEEELAKLRVVDANRAAVGTSGGARSGRKKKVEIVRAEEDLGPATALVGALGAVHSDDDVIVTLEDDTGYGVATVANLLKHHLGSAGGRSAGGLRDAAVAHNGYVLRRGPKDPSGLTPGTTADGLLRPIGHENIKTVHAVTAPTQVDVAETFRGVLYRRRMFLPPRVRSGAVRASGAHDAAERVAALVRKRKHDAVLRCANELIAAALYISRTRTFVVPGTPDTAYWNVPIAADLEPLIGREGQGGGAASDGRFMQLREQALLLEDLVAETIFVSPLAPTP